MTAAQLMILLGGILQLIGVIVTAYGAVATWNTYRPEEKILAPLIDPIERFRERAIGEIRRWLGLVRTHQASARSVADTAMAADAVRVRKQWHELRSNLPLDEAIRELDYRTRDLVDKVYENDERLREITAELRAAVEQLATCHREQAAAHETAMREAAAGGIRIVLLGLSTTGIGIAIVTLGSVPPIA